MPHDVYTGKEVKINVNGITKRLKSIKVKVMGAKYEATASDSRVIQRGTGTLDASIAVEGFDTDVVDGATYAEVAAWCLDQAAPTALEWTDDGATPATRLPANFFTLFPVASWRCDDVDGGSGGPGDPGAWTLNMTPNNLD